MADNETGQEKTEQATPKRKQDARNKGEVARSRELNTMMVMLTSALAFFMIGGDILQELAKFTYDRLLIDRNIIFARDELLEYFVDSLIAVLLILSPFFIVVFFSAFAGSVFISGWIFSFESIKFNWEKIDPIKGVKRIFSVTGLVELLKALLKFILIVSVSAITIWAFKHDIFLLGTEPSRSGLIHTGVIFSFAFLFLNLALVIIALIDVPFQLWNFGKKLKMTRQEIKDELKQTDGNPETRGRIKHIQREMANRRMMEEVPTADVIIVNPTHYSVALKYEENKAGAPIVIAKGTDLIALKIRDIARHNDIIIFTAPPLARALYFSTKIGQQIPEGLYISVAKILAYVYQLSIAKQENLLEPEAPDDFEIPEELLHD